MFPRITSTVSAVRLERVRLRAAWLADKAGRAIGVVDGGNAGEQTFTIEQCWDTGLATVYRRDVGGEENGDVGQCAVEAPALD